MSLVALASRDGYRCGVCSGTIDLTGVGPLAPTIDHVVPAARGGTDSPDNLQLAHSVCNNRKLDRLGFTCPPLGDASPPTPLVLF